MNTPPEPHANACPACQGKGWLVSTRAADCRQAVERCDTCQAYTNDMTAARIARNAGVRCDHQHYPCYLQP